MSWKKVPVDSLKPGDTYRFTTISEGVQGKPSTYKSETTVEVEVPDLPTAFGSVIWAKYNTKYSSSPGPDGNGFPFFLSDRGWVSAKGGFNYAAEDLELVKVVFDAGNPGDYR